MKTKNLLSIFALAITISAFGQKSTMELTFTAEDNGQHVPLNSIFIKNLTQGGDTTLYAPDTVLVLDYITSIENSEAIGERAFVLSQNRPNPFIEKTEVNLYLTEKEYIIITVRDIVGRELTQYKNTLNRGNHSFAFYSGNQKYYLLTVTGKQTSKTIKMLNANSKTTYGEKCKIVYNKYEDYVIGYKSQKAITGFVFNLGDELLMVGYSNLGESGMIDSPSTNQTYTFQFTSNIPCPGVPTVTYEGQVYNTIQIFGQCWLKENLNVGTMINGSQNQQNNSTIEKYCYDNDPANCDTYGGLYQWNEMMQYTTTQGVQGICPPDWHLPTDEEWKQLEGTVDSQYGYPDPEWDDTGLRGFDAGERLKSENGWYNNGNGSDWYSFAGLPGGYRSTNGPFGNLAFYAYFWSSSESGSSAWHRYLSYNFAQVYRSYYSQAYGFSVRCVRD